MEMTAAELYISPQIQSVFNESEAVEQKVRCECGNMLSTAKHMTLKKHQQGKHNEISSFTRIGVTCNN